VKDLKFVIQELEKHRERLLYSKNKIETWEKLDGETLNSPENVETIDSFIFRFCKMQDAMGEKLFPLTLQFLGEEVRNKPFIDILNRLERLEILDSAETWKKLREIKNFLTHVYPWETEETIEYIKIALSYTNILIDIYEKFKKVLKGRGIAI